MCGIFGFSYNIAKSNKFSEVSSDIKLFTQLSRIRGSDTFGISLSSGKKSSHYLNCKPVSLNGKGLNLISDLFSSFSPFSNFMISYCTCKNLIICFIKPYF